MLPARGAVQADVRLKLPALAERVARLLLDEFGGVSGLVEVRIDSATATPIGSFAIANTGGWTSWRDVPGNVTAVTGTHDVFLTFTSGQPQDFVSVQEFHFRR